VRSAWPQLTPWLLIFVAPGFAGFDTIVFRIKARCRPAILALARSLARSPVIVEQEYFIKLYFNPPRGKKKESARLRRNSQGAARNSQESACSLTLRF
jgi:hypothetical protein